MSAALVLDSGCLLILLPADEADYTRHLKLGRTGLASAASLCYSETFVVKHFLHARHFFAFSITISRKRLGIFTSWG